MRARLFCVFLLLSAVISAETNLKYSGEPLKVPYGCVDEELQQAGLLCTEQEPCPIFLELSAISPLGGKLFVGGNLHSTSGTLVSVLLSTDDGGLTWKEPAKRVTGASLEQLQFYDLEHGWAAGETQYPLPRDPFFLLTTDGGQSWRQRAITEEGGPGSVLRFWFDSAKHGELIVDAGKRAETGRYHAFETETGGESWMIRGMTGELPRIKRAPAAFDNPDFRIRAAGKAYAIERRAGEKWDTLSTFAIDAGTCSIKPPEAKEPDPQ